MILQKGQRSQRSFKNGKLSKYYASSSAELAGETRADSNSQLYQIHPVS